MLEVEDVGQRVAGGRDTGAAGQGDLAEAEVPHTRCALAAGVDEHVTDPPGPASVGTLGRVGRVQGRPLREDLQVTDLGQSTLLHRSARRGQQGRRIEVGEGVDHVFDSTGAHRHRRCGTPSVETGSACRGSLRAHLNHGGERRTSRVMAGQSPGRPLPKRRAGWRGCLEMQFGIATDDPSAESRVAAVLKAPVRTSCIIGLSSFRFDPEVPPCSLDHLRTPSFDTSLETFEPGT